jgi:hypothetical protein
VSPDHAIEYDGQNHSVSNVKVNFADSAGMFGTLPAGSSVSNLELIDFDITATSGNAGALVGKIDGTTESKVTVTNVLAYNTTTGTDATVTASGSAGGLIGSMNDGTVEKCAAALVVTGADAGGLIGSAASGEVKESYAAGHTTEGKYTGTKADDGTFRNYNVTASGKAGGLIGDAGTTTISDSYSTCSAAGATAGGFVGTGTGKMTNCYCTGLVDGTTKGAFGASDVDAENCLYFEIINEIPKDNDKSKGYEYLTPLPKAGTSEEEDGTHSGIKPFDETAATYEAFCGGKAAWDDAKPYDTGDKGLDKIYGNQFNLLTIAQISQTTKEKTDEEPKFLSTHYGDWPAPEEFVFN